MTGKAVRLAPATTMAGFKDLSYFENGITVGVREMEHIISEVAMKFRFSRTTVSRVKHKYRVAGRTSDIQQRCSIEKALNERNYPRL